MLKIIKGMQMKRDTTIHSQEELKLKRLNISFKEDVEQLELS